MLALLRYRRIPHRLLLGSHDRRFGLPEPKVNLLPTFYLPNDSGELEAVVDSTPLIRRFEREFADRRVVPDDPLMAFLDALIEDYGDEWLTKAMFHYRWSFRRDIDQAGSILPRWADISAPEEAVQERRRVFTDRQIGRLYVVGSNPDTAPVIEASYRRFLAAFDAVLRHQPFVMGARPGSADFGLYGQLTQLARFDPTPRDLTTETAPRVSAWVDLVDDLSGLAFDAPGWLPREEARGRLGDLLAEIGRVYVPVLLANAKALTQGAERVEAVVDGRKWVQQPFPYQGKCLQWLRRDYQALSASDRGAVDGILSGTGCEPLTTP